MKTLNEIIGTSDFFGEIKNIKDFSFMANYETENLTKWFLAYHGERYINSAFENFSITELAQIVVDMKGDIIENATQYSKKFFDNILTSGETVTKHNITKAENNSSVQKVVPNNLTDFKDKSKILSDNSGTTEDITTVTEKIKSDDRKKIFTNNLIYDIFSIIANTISLYIFSS